jgi:hypothetical protein
MVKSACFLRAVSGRQAEPHFRPVLRDEAWPGQIIPHARTYEDGTWMNVMPDEVLVGGTEIFALPAVD